MRTLVIGGGVTGLALGTRLLATGLPADELLVLESGGEPGGHATTRHEHGFVVEAGPNGFLSREPATLELVREVGLADDLIEARAEAKRRYILRDGQLRIVPDGPPSLLTSDALSVPGKLRLAMEPFARRAPAGVDETVHAFAVRRIGREAADMLVDAAIAGISAGDSRALSVAAAFPLMLEMEREHGSLLRAMVARARAGQMSKLYGLKRGLGSLAGAMADRLGPSLRTGAAVTALEPVAGGWRATLAGGDTAIAERVALAAPAWASAALVEPFDAALAAELARIPFAGVTVVALAWPERALPRPLDGYGYLVTRGEEMTTLGVVWESTLFAGRAPEGHVLLRVVLGGARTPDAVALSDADAVALARRELERAMGVIAMPEHTWVFRRPRAIAQYTLGHLDRVRTARALAARHPGLELVGTSYDGVSFNHAIASAATLAHRWAATPDAVADDEPEAARRAGGSR